MELTLAIPAHNDHQGLCRLLKCVVSLNFIQHVVVVDDGSDIPITAAALIAASGLGADQLTLLRHDTARGAGAARNLALNSVQTEHVLFLDADDLPTRELPHLLTDLDGRFFDFCIFQHRDTRMEQRTEQHMGQGQMPGRTPGQMPHDQAHWHWSGVEVGALTAVSERAAAHLCRTANYPWNKIYRTAFLRDNGIRCSETPVHNDIELHWRSFLNASQILASDRFGVIHFVTKGHDRLTNRSGDERFMVFVPLERIAAEIKARDTTHFALPFFRFSISLFDWISDTIKPELRNQFTDLASEFIHTHAPVAIQDYIAQDDPVLVARVLHRQTNRT